MALSVVGCVWERGPDRAERGAGSYGNPGDARGDVRRPEGGPGDERYRGDLRDRDRDDYCMRHLDECRR